jgi:hypothetical protein
MKSALVTLKVVILFSVCVLEACVTRAIPPPNVSSIHTFPDERIALHFAINGQYYYAFFFDLQITSPPLSPNTDMPLAFRFKGPAGTKVVNAHELASIKAGPAAGVATVTLRDGSSVSVRRETISVWYCPRKLHDICDSLEGLSPPFPPQAWVYRDPIRDPYTNPVWMSYPKIMSADEMFVDIDDAYQRDLELLSDAKKNYVIASQASQVANIQRKEALIEAQRAEQGARRDANAALINQLGQEPIGAMLFCSTEPDWPRHPGDAVDRQSLVCHLAGKSNCPPLMGAALLTSGWTIASESRRTKHNIIIVDMGTVEITEVTLRKSL